MIHLATKIPHKIYLACSGGVDSMVLLDFLLATNKRQITVLHVNHDTAHGREAELFVKSECARLGVDVLIKRIHSTKKKGQSQEEFWRNERLDFFRQQDGIVATAHHLDDAIEWWIFSSLRGYPKLIPVESGNMIKPLLFTDKGAIINWAKKKNIKYINDPSNKDNKYARNMIRNEIVPNALKVNPGLRKVIKKLYENKLSYKAEEMDENYG